MKATNNIFFALISLIVLVGSAFAELPDYNTVKQEFIKWEGCQSHAYQVNGLWHNGIGHLLTNNDDKRDIWDDREIDCVFQLDLYRAIKDAKAVFPFYDNVPSDIQLILVDIAFNLGRNGLATFVKFKTALQREDYRTAANELENSRWYGKVGQRSKHHVEIVRSHSF
jgi:lysozyme